MRGKVAVCGKGGGGGTDGGNGTWGINGRLCVLRASGCSWSVLNTRRSRPCDVPVGSSALHVSLKILRWLKPIRDPLSFVFVSFAWLDFQPDDSCWLGEVGTTYLPRWQQVHSQKTNFECTVLRILILPGTPRVGNRSLFFSLVAQNRRCRSCLHDTSPSFRSS